MVSVGLDLCGRAIVSKVSEGPELCGRHYEVYGSCWVGPGWSGLWCLWCVLVWTWVVGLCRLWCLMCGSLVGGRGYGVSGVCISHLHRGVWSASPWVIYA